MNILIKRNNEILIIDMNRNKKFRLSLPIFSIKDMKPLRNRQVVTGYVGPRGSGKSVGATRSVCLDYLLKGYDVWSNMWMGFKQLMPDGKLITRETQPFGKMSLKKLDKEFRKGAIVIDEPNIEFFEARRSQSNINLEGSHLLQEIRKRQLDVVWMAQSEYHVDNRLRFQTDIFVQCKDASTVKGFKRGIGEMSQWRIYDFSGMVLGKVPNDEKAGLFNRLTVNNEPWWNCFDTTQLQGGEDDYIIEENTDNEIEEIINRAVKVFTEKASYNEKRDYYYCYRYDLWDGLKIADDRLKASIASNLNTLGIHGHNRMFISKNDPQELLIGIS